MPCVFIFGWLFVLVPGPGLAVSETGWMPGTMGCRFWWEGSIFPIITAGDEHAFRECDDEFYAST